MSQKAAHVHAENPEHIYVTCECQAWPMQIHHVATVDMDRGNGKFEKETIITLFCARCDAYLHLKIPHNKILVLTEEQPSLPPMRQVKENN